VWTKNICNARNYTGDERVHQPPTNQPAFPFSIQNTLAPKEAY